MLTAPKTTSALLTMENAQTRFVLVEGDGSFEFVGISSVEKKGTGTSKVLLNFRSLWEVVCVRPTRNVGTEHFKTVLPSAVAPTVSNVTLSDRQRVTLTWSNILVDGLSSDADLDRLNVIVQLDLLEDEAFLRMRIKAFWAVNNTATNANPGKYAIWRVRFPVVDVSPTSSQVLTSDPDQEGEDALVLPEGHGVVVDSPEQRAGGDPVMGMWSLQDRSSLVRNVIRPGDHWRQTYPGLVSTQAMGYYGKRSGRGVLVGCLDPVGRIKDLEAGAEAGSIWMAVVHVPPWCYSIGNRPSGFTGAQEGDHQSAYLALGSHLPHSLQDLPELDQQVPDARELAVGGEVTPDDESANAGEAGVGLLALGWPGSSNTNTLASLGYESEFDCVLMPTQGYGPSGWNAIAAAWRSINVVSDAAFPLREVEDDPDAPLPASRSALLLELDASVHDGQRTTLGLDDADLPTALEEVEGVVLEAEAVSDLIVPAEIVAPRAAVNDISVLTEGSEFVSVEVLGADGAPADLVNASIGQDGRGYLRAWGKSGFYVAPAQVVEDDWLGSSQDLGRLTFEDLLPASIGVQIGDIVRVVSDSVVSFSPFVGRATRVVASDSERYPSNGSNDQARVVMGFGSSPDTIVVGRYVGGVLEPWAFTPIIGNNPGYRFEVEILRKELNALISLPVAISGGVRVEVRVDALVIQECYPQSALGWAEVVDIDGSEYPFIRLYVDDGIVYLEMETLGQPASFFNGKAARVRPLVSPIDWYSLGVSEGHHIVIPEAVLNGAERVIKFGDADDVDELLHSGYLGFEQPIVPEPGSFTVNVYAPVGGENRLLGPDADVAGAGRRFVDTGLSSGGGFRAIARSGDILLVTNASEEDNQEPFEVAEVRGDFELIVDRDFVTEEGPGGGFTYRLLRRGRLLRVLPGDRRGFRALRSGRRQLLEDGRDRVHFLAIGFVVDSSAPVTGVFGVDSSAWGDLGSNPFIPASSTNLTTYRTNSRGVRKPSQEFKIASVLGDRVVLARGWELETSTFSVTFTDIGAKTFTKNVLQFRIVRDDRDIESVHDWAGSSSAISGWSNSLQSSALVALVRGWQAHMLGWDQPGFLPPRGRYLEFLAAQSVRVLTAVDPHQIRPDDEDGLYEAAQLEAASYFNRFGSRQASVPAGDPATGESDELVHPGVPFAQRYLLSEVLGDLSSVGLRDFLLDRLEEGSRPQFGSPHYFKPLDGVSSSSTSFEVTSHGGSADFAEGWRQLIAQAQSFGAVTSPMDWLIGMVDFAARDWSVVEREFPDVELVLPINGSESTSLSTATVTGLEFFVPSLTFDAITSELYGQDQTIEPGDVLELLPSGTRHVIDMVLDQLVLEDAADLSGETSFRILIQRNFAHESVNAPSFFRFAFGEFAVVAADVTFLANDISWLEVIEKTGSSISQAQYEAAVLNAFSRAMHNTAVGCINGLLPSVRVESEGAKRMPPDRYGHQFEQPGTNSLLEQSSVQFPSGASKYDLIGTHLRYLRSLMGRMDEVVDWVRLGASEQEPEITGSTSNRVYGVQWTPGRYVASVQASAFSREDGDLLFVTSNWAPKPIGTGEVEEVSLSWSFAERGITSGYWAVVEVRRNLPNLLVSSVFDVSADPSIEDAVDFEIAPLQTRMFMLYQQDVIVRLDESAVEVDRVLVVPSGRSAAAAFATIVLDAAKGGSMNYVVVLGEGAILDDLTIPSIVGATIEVQRSPDENPQISETV